MTGALFPLFWWPMFWQDDKTWTTKIGQIAEIGYHPWFWHFTFRENRGNRDPFNIFLRWSAKSMTGPLFALFWWPISWQDDKTWTTKIGKIGEIGILLWFWHLTLGKNRGNRKHLIILEENYVCRYVLIFFGDCLVYVVDDCYGWKYD